MTLLEPTMNFMNSFGSADWIKEEVSTGVSILYVSWLFIPYYYETTTGLAAALIDESLVL